MDAPDLGPRYQPLYRLAAGGMAEVWVGAQKVAAAQRPVAIKRILPQFAEEEKYVRMFLDEAHLAACIDSPNVVALIDADIAKDGAPFLVMELVEGLPLSTMIRSKPAMDQGTVCYVIKEAALGLHDAHEARAATGELLQLVHRDVSPQNLLLGVDGRVRLADFGVAHALERMTLTVGGEFKGKLAYCAPEQLHGKADRRADIFSLGVVIRQALSGQKLFGKSSGNAETLRKLLHEEIQPTKVVAPHVEDALAAVIDKALCRDPDSRYENAAAFAEALTPFVRASRVSLGELVQAAGGVELQQRRDKTTEMFTALKAGAPTAPLTSDPAHSLVALSPTAQTPVPAPGPKPAPATRSRFWPTTLVMAGAAAIGVVVALNVGGETGSYETTDLREPTDVLSPEVSPPEETPIPAIGSEQVHGGEAHEEPTAEPAQLETTERETTERETTERETTERETERGEEEPPSADRTSEVRGSQARSNQRTRQARTTMTANADSDAPTDDEPTATAMTPPTAEPDGTGGETMEEDSTAMGRASRLRRDVF